MRKVQKSLLFWMLIVLTGVLTFGMPVPVMAEENAVPEGTAAESTAEVQGTASPEETEAQGAASSEETEAGESAVTEETVTEGEAGAVKEGQIHKPSQASGAEDGKTFVDDSTDNTYGYYTIMGNTTVSTADMAAHFNRQNMEYPGAVLEKGGAGDIDTFCAIIAEEAEAENVRAEIVFEQVMLETGWLQFQGDCKAEQFNFAGLGATGNGEPGITFPDVRTGIRAQVQHLKAYASSEELSQECVDERFPLVMRESAPYVEWLGIKENPYGGGWAAGEGYGYKLRSLLAELKGEEYTPPAPTPAPETVAEGEPTPEPTPESTPTADSESAA